MDVCRDCGVSDVVLTRDAAGNPVTNVPCQVVVHSPTGFEWGYGGSGPADLALNILLLFTDRVTAEQSYQAFKWAFIAPMPEGGGRIAAGDVREWVEKQRREVG